MVTLPLGGPGHGSGPVRSPATYVAPSSSARGPMHATAACHAVDGPSASVDVLLLGLLVVDVAVTAMESYFQLPMRNRRRRTC